MTKKIIVNAAKCKVCGDLITSKHVHDFNSCSCGNVCVDGGNEYLRRLIHDDFMYKELSVVED